MRHCFALTISSLGFLTAVGCSSPSADDSLPSEGLLPAESSSNSDTRSPATSAPGPKAQDNPEAVAALYAKIADTRSQRAQPTADAGTGQSSTGAPSVHAPLPGRSARTIVHQEVNEAENLFFSEEGRLFVSGAEDIYEITRAADGTFTKTDYFAEDCVVEGIVRVQNYLYGACWTMDDDLTVHSYLVGGELSIKPDFKILGPLADGVVANGMTVDPEGRVYVTYSASNGQIARLTFSKPGVLSRKEIWAEKLSQVNGIKYLNGAFYVTLLSETLTSEFVQIPVLPDGSAGKPQKLYQRWLTVLDDVLPFADGFILTDFLAGTLLFWNPSRGVYAETPAQTFYGPTSIAIGKPPLFDEHQILVAEKGNFLIRDEKNGDLLSAYRLP